MVRTKSNASVRCEGRSNRYFGGLDGSQTIGCFVRHCPFVFDTRDKQGNKESWLAFVEQYRNVPHGGVDFGLLQYLCADDECSDLYNTPDIEVEFNYVEATKKKTRNRHSLGAVNTALVGRLFKRSMQYRDYAAKLEDNRLSGIRLISQCHTAKKYISKKPSTD